jgi:hypothetical protein
MHKRKAAQQISNPDIDAAFVSMAQDTTYTREAIALAQEFEKSDWEAFQSGLEIVPAPSGSNTKESKLKPHHRK